MITTSSFYDPNLTVISENVSFWKYTNLTLELITSMEVSAPLNQIKIHPKDNRIF